MTSRPRLTDLTVDTPYGVRRTGPARIALTHDWLVTFRSSSASTCRTTT